MNATQDLWAVKYNSSQEQTHIDMGEIIASNNLRLLASGTPNETDNNTMAIADSYEEAHRIR